MTQSSAPPDQPLSRREEIARHIVQLREEFGALYDQVEEILFRRDPIRIFPPTRDEYSPELRAILPQLAGCSSPVEVTALTHAVFVRFFNAKIAGPVEKYAAIGDEIWAAIEASRTGR